MDLNIRGKAALVCASTGGLGRATAEALADEGAKVVFAGRRGEVAKEAAAQYENAVGIEADTSTVQGAAALYDAAVDAVGELDILVLNGPGPRPGPATSIDGDDMMAAFQSLAVVQQSLVARALPHMKQQHWGRILSIASSGVVAPITGLVLSSIGRMALAGYLKALANEIAGDAITVNMLLPGRIATDRLKSLDESAVQASGRSMEQVQESATRSIPAGRYGNPAEFGAMAAFLCGDLASYVTGVAIRCDGGAHSTL